LFAYVELVAENKMPLLSNILEMRQNPEVVKEYTFSVFLPCVQGKHDWRRRIKSQKPSSFVHVNTEAYLYLMIENSYDKWVSMATPSEGNEDRTIVETKWVCKKGFTCRYQSWENQALPRYEELVKMVKADRARNGTVEVEYMLNNRNKSSAFTATSPINNVTYKMYDDLDA
jgi:hypothetical protein